MVTNPGRIHILGVGNLARLYAHALSQVPDPPPITLLFHRQSLLNDWEKAGRKIEITTNGVPAISSSYNIEIVSQPGSDNEANSRDIIENLIVTTKTTSTVKAISSIRHRLNQKSTILFTQNGMGTVDEVTASLFPSPSDRPQYLAAITSHGVYSTGPFKSVHAGLAHVTISNIQSPSEFQSQYLLDKILDASILVATAVSSQELKIRQLEKLVINAMINPLSVIFNCRNGDIFTSKFIMRVLNLLLAETSRVLVSLPEFQGDESAKERFQVERLETTVMRVAEMVAGNTSSMLQDVRAGRETEIDYINGWIVKKGKEVRVDVSSNETLVGMVKRGTVISDAESENYFPSS